MLSFSETVRRRRRTNPFSARKLPRLISAASTIRMFTLYSWQWLSCPAARYVRFFWLFTEHVITTLGPVSCRITSSATNLVPLCDNSNISYNNATYWIFHARKREIHRYSVDLHWINQLTRTLMQLRKTSFVVYHERKYLRSHLRRLCSMHLRPQLREHAGSWGSEGCRVENPPLPVNHRIFFSTSLIRTSNSLTPLCSCNLMLSGC